VIKKFSMLGFEKPHRGRGAIIPFDVKIMDNRLRL